MAAKLKTVYAPDLSTSRSQSLYEAQVPAGFPSPATDYEEDKLDLNKYLIKNPVATFFVKVTGDSMIGAGIHHGDLLVVDRSIEPKDKRVVIAVLDGELTVKRIRIRGGKVTLQPENLDYCSQEISEGAEFEIWGVVTSVVHKL